MRPFESMVRSFGWLYRFPSNRSVSTVSLPERSVRVTRRCTGSHATSRPSRSKSRPFVPAFSRYTDDWPSRPSRQMFPPKDVTPGTPMTGINAGWVYLDPEQANWAYSICGFTFALFMIPGGRLQDRYGPRLGATLAGLCLGGGCVLAGVMKSYAGLVLGFGVLGGIGMGLGYAAATPAAVRWFGPHQRGLIVGLVVSGYGGAAIYIAPLAKSLIADVGLSGSFIGLGLLFALVVIVAGLLLSLPPAGYVPPGAPPLDAPARAGHRSAMTRVDWSAADMVKTWQFYALVFLFIGSAQSGLLVIANATPMLNRTARTIAFLAANAWLLSSFGGLINATGRIGTGMYSDRIGRIRAYRVNGL